MNALFNLTQCATSHRVSIQLCTQKGLFDVLPYFGCFCLENIGEHGKNRAFFVEIEMRALGAVCVIRLSGTIGCFLVWFCSPVPALVHCFFSVNMSKVWWFFVKDHAIK